jgi:hypothetical protein
MKPNCSCFSPQKRTIEPEQTAVPCRHNLRGGFLSLLLKGCVGHKPTVPCGRLCSWTLGFHNIYLTTDTLIMCLLQCIRYSRFIWFPFVDVASNYRLIDSKRRIWDIGVYLRVMRSTVKAAVLVKCFVQGKIAGPSEYETGLLNTWSVLPISAGQVWWSYRTLVANLPLYGPWKACRRGEWSYSSVHS